jgi:hypothetical protein
MPRAMTSMHSGADMSQTIAASVKWILAQRNASETWGSEDQDQELDRFVTTRHVVMTMLELGFAVDSAYLKPAIRYLAELNAEGIDPYWRIELLALTPEYTPVVMQDAEAAMRRLRAGTNLPQRLWPLPYFLLRFCSMHPELMQQLSFTSQELIQIVKEEFSPSGGCRGDASLTAMAAAELSRFDFADKDHILRQMLSYIDRRRTNFNLPYRRPGFELNHVRDFYLISCLTRYPEFYRRSLSNTLRTHIRSIAESAYKISDAHRWSAVPAYGGRVGAEISPTAFGVRALVSYYSIENAQFRRDVLADILDLVLAERFFRLRSGSVGNFLDLTVSRGPVDTQEPGKQEDESWSSALPRDFILTEYVTDRLEDATNFDELAEWLVDFRDSVLTVNPNLSDPMRLEGIMLAGIVAEQIASRRRDLGNIRIALSRLTDIAFRAAGDPPLGDIIDRISRLNEITDELGL